MRAVVKWIVRIIGVGMVLLVGGCIVLMATTPAPPSGPADEGRPADKQAAEQPAPKPERPDDYLRITGTAKTASCSVLDDDSQRSIDTPVPSTIKLNVGWGGTASVTCQKTNDLSDSSLRLELVANGATKRGETTAQAGVVSLVAP
jgi:hypothetical protein